MEEEGENGEEQQEHLSDTLRGKRSEWHQTLTSSVQSSAVHSSTEFFQAPDREQKRVQLNQAMILCTMQEKQFISLVI